jgi:radical SAM superfamily enzyme YgiQ (UPF0313 family)
MKVAVLYPPFRKDGQYPLLGQNRQFKFSRSREVRIFPLVPAHLATDLKAAGHEVLWLDGVNRRYDDAAFDREVDAFAPDLVFLETKAPVVRRHWEYVAALKGRLPGAKTVLMGDHVTYFPAESLENSPVDYILTGGDYDFVGAGIADHLVGKGALPPGVWFRDSSGRPDSTGPAHLEPHLDRNPFIDRDLTRFLDYGEAYLLPGAAYILTGRGCGSGKSHGGPGVGVCTFCIWQHALWGRTARLRSPANVAAEMEEVHRRYGTREFFDDNESGPIYDVAWLRDFLGELKARRLLGRFRISSNCRADIVTAESLDLMAACGWRLLKIGLESGNDATLKRLAKCEDVELVKRGVKMAKDRGMRVLMTIMFGYPWEGEEEARRTYEVARELLDYKTRTGDCLQASVILPYPGSPLWHEAVRRGWLLVGEKEYERYDMGHPILKAPVDGAEWCRRTWGLMSRLPYAARQVLTARSLDEANLLWRGLRSLLGHRRDYSDDPGTPNA